MDECEPLVSGYTTASVAATAAADVVLIADAVSAAAVALSAIGDAVALETAAGVKVGGVMRSPSSAS